jgi:hypothetical protein
MDETMSMALCYYIIMNTKMICESLALFNGEHAFMDENMRSHNFLLPTSENKNKWERLWLLNNEHAFLDEENTSWNKLHPS